MATAEEESLRLAEQLDAEQESLRLARELDQSSAPPSVSPESVDAPVSAPQAVPGEGADTWYDDLWDGVKDIGRNRFGIDTLEGISNAEARIAAAQQSGDPGQIIDSVREFAKAKAEFDHLVAGQDVAQSLLVPLEVAHEALRQPLGGATRAVLGVPGIKRQEQLKAQEVEKRKESPLVESFAKSMAGAIKSSAELSGVSRPLLETGVMNPEVAKSMLAEYAPVIAMTSEPARLLMDAVLADRPEDAAAAEDADALAGLGTAILESIIGPEMLVGKGPAVASSARKMNAAISRVQLEAADALNDAIRAGSQLSPDELARIGQLRPASPLDVDIHRSIVPDEMADPLNIELAFQKADDEFVSFSQIAKEPPKIGADILRGKPGTRLGIEEKLAAEAKKAGLTVPELKSPTRHALKGSWRGETIKSIHGAAKKRFKGMDDAEALRRAEYKRITGKTTLTKMDDIEVERVAQAFGADTSVRPKGSLPSYLLKASEPPKGASAQQLDWLTRKFASASKIFGKWITDTMDAAKTDQYIFAKAWQDRAKKDLAPVLGGGKKKAQLRREIGRWLEADDPTRKLLEQGWGDEVKNSALAAEKWLFDIRGVGVESKVLKPEQRIERYLSRMIKRNLSADDLAAVLRRDGVPEDQIDDIVKEIFENSGYHGSIDPLKPIDFRFANKRTDFVWPDEIREFDVAKVLDTYVQGLSKRIYVEPVRREVAAIAESLPGGRNTKREALTDWLAVEIGSKREAAGVGGSVVRANFKAIEHMANVLKDAPLVGRGAQRVAARAATKAKYADQTYLRMAKVLTDLSYMGGMGFRAKSALRNLTQTSLTAGEIGGANVLRGYRDMMKAVGSKTSIERDAIKSASFMKRTGFHENLVQDIENIAGNMLVEAGRKFKGLSFKMFRNSDLVNRITAFSGGRAQIHHLASKYGAKSEQMKSLLRGLDKYEAGVIGKYLDAGDVESASRVYGEYVTGLTQFKYGSSDRAAFFANSPILRQYNTWWWNFAKLQKEWATRGEKSELNKLGRLLVNNLRGPVGLAVAADVIAEGRLSVGKDADEVILANLYDPKEIEELMGFVPDLRPYAPWKSQEGVIARGPFQFVEGPIPRMAQDLMTVLAGEIGVADEHAVTRALTRMELNLGMFVPGGLLANDLYKAGIRDKKRGISESGRWIHRLLVPTAEEARWYENNPRRRIRGPKGFIPAVGEETVKFLQRIPGKRSSDWWED